MNRLKSKLKLADRGSMLILAFTFVVVAPVYYASTRSQAKEISATHQVDVNQPAAEAPAAAEELTEKSAAEVAAPAQNSSSAHADKSKKPAGESHKSKSESKPKPKNCSSINREAGERYLQQLQQIRKDHQDAYNYIIRITSFLSLKSKISALNQQTYMKELSVYNTYVNEVRAAACAPSGYNAP